MNRTDTSYFMVRAMAQTEEDFRIFFDRSVAAVGWSQVNFSACQNPNQLVEEVARTYYPPGSAAPHVMGRKLNEAQRFKAIRPGDRILVPFHNAVAVALAGEEEIYDPRAGKTRDLANQRRVEYFRTKGEIVAVPRSKLSEGLQRRLRGRGATVSDLSEFADEVESLFDSENVGWQVHFANVERAAAVRFKEALLRNLQEGRTNLEAGGVGLERLVRDLLRVEGYTAEIPGKRAFQGWGDADVIATKSDKFGETRLLVQVKHHFGKTGTFGAEQLLEILRGQSEEYRDHRLVLVTTATATDELRELCDNRDIVLLTGPELVDWVFEQLASLSTDLKIKLGITGVPIIGF